MPTYSLLLIALISACSHNTGTQQRGTEQKKNAGQGQKLQIQALEKQIEQIASAAKGRVGVATVVLESEESVPNNPDQQLSISLNAHDHFPMQSVYKLPIGMTVMKQVEE